MIDHIPPGSDPTLEGHRLISRPDYLVDRSGAVDDLESVGPPTATSSISAYVHAFRRRWFAAISLGLLCGGLATSAAWFAFTHEYTATVHFRVAATPESLIFDDARAGDTLRRDEYEIYQNTQQQLIRTDYVIKAALRPDAVHKLPIVRQQKDADRWLAEQISTKFPNEGEVMNLSLTANTPEEAALLTASVAKAYIDEVVTQETKNRSKRLSELQNTLRDKNAERDQKNTELKELAKELGSKDTQALSNQQRVAQDHWMAVYREWIIVQNEVTRLQAQLELKQTDLKRAQEADADAVQALVSHYVLESARTQDPILADLKLQLEKMQQEIGELRRTSTAAQIQRHEQTHSQNLKELEQRVALRQEVLGQDLRRLHLAMLSDEIAQATSQLDTQTRLEERLRGDEERLRESVKEFGGSSLVVESLQKEIDALDRIIDPMDTQARELEIELRRPNRVTRITRLESEQRTGQVTSDADLQLEELAAAIQPVGPDSNARIRKTAASGIACMGLVLMGILYWDVRGKHVNSSTDVSSSLGLSVIGAIPLIPSRAVNRSGSSSPRYRRWRTLLNESMRGVMVRLLYDAPAGESRVVFVSSAASGEGKSTLATNLGVAMARAGYRTLLVDFDLRRPSLDGLFDLPAEPGVSEILRREATVEQSIQTVEPANLSVLPAGNWSLHDVSLLANGATEGIFAELREAYQFVIVDGAPILGVAESQLLCRHADTVLLSVLRDVSSRPKIFAACETLANFGVRSLYAVVTGTSSEDHKHYYAGYAINEDREW
ncbi:MAG: exopolysaccharide transport family protein [Pirellulaceae bacterium]